MQALHYDWIRRGIRTFFQAFLGSVILLGFPIMTSFINAVNSGQDADLDLGVWKRILLAAVFSGVIALVTMLHNVLEDNVPAVPALLKGKASSGESPVPEPKGGVVEYGGTIPRGPETTLREHEVRRPAYQNPEDWGDEDPRAGH